MRSPFSERFSPPGVSDLKYKVNENNSDFVGALYCKLQLFIFQLVNNYFPFFDKFLSFFNKYLSIFGGHKKSKMKPTTKLILTILHVIAWIIFLGLCVKTGAILYSFIVSLAMTPEGAKNLYMELNLSGLYHYDRVYYIIIVSSIIVLSALKALLFYFVVKIFLRINFVKPFSEDVARFISLIGYLALGIGVLTEIVNKSCDWLARQGVTFPDLQSVLGGADEFLLLGAVIFMISQVFKRGIEIQTENELTV